MEDIKPRYSRPEPVSRPVFQGAQRSPFSAGPPPTMRRPEPSAPQPPQKQPTQRKLKLRKPNLRIKVSKQTPKRAWTRYRVLSRKYQFASRMSAFGFVAILIASVIAQTIQPTLTQNKYDLSKVENNILSNPVQQYAEKLTNDPKTGDIKYNSGYSGSGSDVAGQSSGPKITANFSNSQNDNVVKVTDPVNNVDVTLKPRFKMDDPQKNQNRVVYPIVGKNATNVYTVKGSLVKEDIILNSYSAKEMQFDYDIDVSKGLETRIEGDGSLGVYGPSLPLLGNVSTGSDKDADLLQKARDNSEKTNLIFRIPAPFVVETSTKSSQAKAWFELKGNRLTVHAGNLDKASYPMSIDPSVYVETAAKLMRGNNETNVNFDTDNELIEKGQTTGARFNTWDQTLSMGPNRWNGGAAVAGGYIYYVGGGSADTTRYNQPGTTTYTVPAGVTSLTYEMWGGGGGGGGSSQTFAGGAGGGAGYTSSTITVTPGEVLNMVIGAGGVGGGYVSDGGFGSGHGGAGGGYSGIFRTTTPLSIAGGGGGGGGGNGDSAGAPAAGSAGGAGGGTTGVAGSNNTDATTGGGAGTPSAGGAAGVSATSGGTAGASLQGGTGASLLSLFSKTSLGGGGAGGYGSSSDTDTTQRRPGAGGGGGGYFGGGGGGRSNGQGAGGGGGGGGSSVVTGTSPLNTQGSGATPGNSADADRVGAGSGGAGGTVTGVPQNGTAGTTGTILMITTGTLAAANSTVYWGQLNSNTGLVQSPNPGAGSCTNWCTNSAYNLPAARRSLSLVAYNGFLFAFGGANSTCAGTGNICNTVYIAKLGANGEPALWHPTGGTPVYWYTDTNLSSTRAFEGAVAYNNRMYLVGGLTTGNTPVTTVEYANINPQGTLGTWTTTGMTALTGARYGMGVHIYNDRMYVLGGNATYAGTPLSTVQYAKINNDGTMNAWVSTNGFVSGQGRQTMGGSMTTIVGGYVYLSGGCSVVNASGYCTTIRDDIQLASINADGSLGEWNTILGLTNGRIGHSLISWQNSIYGIGGCFNQQPALGTCAWAASAIDRGKINQDGDASTVNNSTPSGTAPCSGGAAYNCDIPPPGDDVGEGGQMSSSIAINNGFIYIIGGCTDISAAPTNAECSNGDAMSGNTSYAALSSTGTIVAPASCAGTSYGTWCVDSSNVIYNSQTAVYSTGTLTQSGFTVTGAGTTWTAAYVGRTLRYNDGTTALITARASNTSITVNATKTIGTGQTYGFYGNGVGTAAATVFNNTIYVVGGTNGSANGFTSNIYSNTLNANGSLAGAWTLIPTGTSGLPTTFANMGAGNNGIGYSYAFTRANPSSAGTTPGNLFILGGCMSTGAGIGCNAYTTGVYKCNIGTAGGISGCTTTGQMQIDADNINSGVQGLGLMAGTVYANRVYLVGGACTAVTSYINVTDPCASDTSPVINNNAQRKETMFAKIDNSNNIVDADATSPDNLWNFTTGQMNPVRRRAVAFGYNGYIYSLAGYSGSASLQDLLFAKIDVSTGDIGSFGSSGVVVTPRWDLRAIVSNGYVYALGGCGLGSAPDGCTDMQEQVQTFQLYNNDSGSPVAYNAGNNIGVDRIGGNSAIMNGYIYYAGGCTNIGCTTFTNTTYYAPIGADGVIGAWAAGGNLPGAKGWGKLVNNGGTLYYLGGQTGTAVTTAVGNIYYSTAITAGNPTWGTTTTGVGNTGSGNQNRTQFGAAVWNDRIYVVGGFTGASTTAVTNTVYVSAPIASGGDINSNWTSTNAFNVARAGLSVVAYANNLYILGGFDGTNYLNDTQFAEIDSDDATDDGGAVGIVRNWTYSTSLPGPLRDAEAVASNGYMYLVGGRSSASSCVPNTIVAPVSANTKIDPQSGGTTDDNIPTGIGEWYETNSKYSGDRYGAAVALDQGKLYILGGGCTSIITSTDRTSYTAVRSQPQVARYSRMMDTDTDVFPTKWLLNGVDNSVGARWKLKYRSMTDIDGITADCVSDMTSWGTETNFGDVTLGSPQSYVPRDGSNVNTNCARYFYFSVTIDSSQAFGYPEDVTRGPTIADLSLFFTSDPSKRLRHGKTFTGGEQQPLDTPFP